MEIVNKYVSCARSGPDTYLSQLLLFLPISRDLANPKNQHFYFFWALLGASGARHLKFCCPIMVSNRPLPSNRSDGPSVVSNTIVRRKSADHFRGSLACETFVLVFATRDRPKPGPFMGVLLEISLRTARRGCSNGKPRRH